MNNTMASAPPSWLNSLGRAANRTHVALYRWSAGKWANRIANLPVLLITNPREGDTSEGMSRPASGI
jgi:hypothetical protein